VPEAAWINKPKAESNKIFLAKTAAIPEVARDGPLGDRRSWGILETSFSNQAGKTDGNDIKFETEVSHFH
jgi:hypothetical protein